MYRKCLILTICAINVITLGAEDSGDVENDVFDQDLYENALNSHKCKKHLSEMKTFESDCTMSLICRTRERLECSVPRTLQEYCEVCEGQSIRVASEYVYDASFRIPQGILKGNFASMGSYHQCLGISQGSRSDPIQGKYCMMVVTPYDLMAFPILSGTSWLEDLKWMYLDINATIKSLSNFNESMGIGNRIGRQRKWVDGITIFNDLEFSLAMCIPKTCTLGEALAPAINDSLSPDVEFDYDEEFCRLPDDKPVVAADYVAIAIFSFIGILTISSTTLDIRHRFLLKQDPKEANELFRCCSLYTNAKDLLTFRSSPGAVDCVDGIRAIAMIWVVMGHTLIYNFSKYTANIVDLVNWAGASENTWVTSSAELSVDTFFVLSGLLLVYACVGKMKPTKFLQQVPLLYLRRLVRTVPLLACAVLLQASLLHRVADGVDWQYMASFVTACRRHWHTALLHVQNITNPVDLCLPPTWYLAVDMQLHALAPLLLGWLLRGRRAACAALAGSLSAVVAAGIIFLCSVDLTTGYNIEVYFYQNPLMRAPAFIVGMVFGYILHIFRGDHLKLPVWFVSVGYIAAAGVAWCCITFLYSAQESQLLVHLNQFLVRPCWGLCVCWVIFACAHGYGGPVNWFLSLSIWKFTARISYALFLFHYPVILIIGSSRVTSFYFSVKNFFVQFAGVLAGAGAAAAAATALVDAPCAALLRRTRTPRAKPGGAPIPSRRQLKNEATNEDANLV